MYVFILDVSRTLLIGPTLYFYNAWNFKENSPFKQPTVGSSIHKSHRTVKSFTVTFKITKIRWQFSIHAGFF